MKDVTTLTLDCGGVIRLEREPISLDARRPVAITESFYLDDQPVSAELAAKMIADAESPHVFYEVERSEGDPLPRL
jgi:hypothetical protein